MNIDQEKINLIGKALEKIMTGFFGSIRFNIKNGRYINANIEHSIQPERQEKKHVEVA